MKQIISKKKFHNNEAGIQDKIYSQHVLQRIPLEKARKILLDSGLNLTNDEITEVIELVHKLAEITIKEYILK